MDLLLDRTDWTVTHARAVKSSAVFIKIISQCSRIIFFLLACFTAQKDTCKVGFLFFSQPFPTHAERLMSSFRLSSILAPCGPKGARNTLAVMWYEKQKADFYLIKRAISLIPWCRPVNDSITTNTNLPLKKNNSHFRSRQGPHHKCTNDQIALTKFCDQCNCWFVSLKKS